GALDRATLERSMSCARPALHLTTAVLATAGRDLRALAVPPARALAKERRKVLSRFGTIDDAWLEAKRTRGATLAEMLARSTPRTKEAWFDGVLEIAAAIHGAESATRLAEARVRLTALGAARRRKAREPIEI